MTTSDVPATIVPASTTTTTTVPIGGTIPTTTPFVIDSPSTVGVPPSDDGLTDEEVRDIRNQYRATRVGNGLNLLAARLERSFRR